MIGQFGRHVELVPGDDVGINTVLDRTADCIFILIVIRSVNMPELCLTSLFLVVVERLTYIHF